MSCRSVQLDAGVVLEHPEADSVPPAQELLLRVSAHVQVVVEQVSLAKNVRAQARARSERLQAGRPVRAPGRLCLSANAPAWAPSMRLKFFVLFLKGLSVRNVAVTPTAGAGTGTPPGRGHHDIVDG